MYVPQTDQMEKNKANDLNMPPRLKQGISQHQLPNPNRTPGVKANQKMGAR